MNISVSSSLLEDIFRLLDYLDMRHGYDESHFHKSGYSQRLENDNALWELRIKIRQLQGKIVETYLLTVDDVAESEMRDLLEWVAAGKSVYDNPCLIYDSSGRPMDFINACRMDLEMTENPSDFFSERLDTVEDIGRDDELPF